MIERTLERSPSQEADAPDAEVELAVTEGHQIVQVALWKRVFRVITNKDVLTGCAALFRTVTNTGISIADAFPGIGDVVSFGADGAKVFTRVCLKVGIDPKLDLTPDVSISIALGAELAEPVTGGLAPTHAVETAIQAKHDLPRLLKALQVARSIIASEYDDWEENQATLESAIEYFLPGVKRLGTKDNKE